MPSDPNSTAPRGFVVTHVPNLHDHASRHERVTLQGFAQRLAALLGYELAGEWDPGRQYGGPVYFVPSITLQSEEAATLGIAGPDDLFGGVVPHCFVGSKAISHPLVAPDAAAVEGWNPELAERLGDAVLAGYSAFAVDDALRAGRTLLAAGPARIKPVRATGGRGQVVIRDIAHLQQVLAAMDPAEIRDHGVVLEENLAEVRTFSVGQVQVGGLLATYHGVQKLTRNNTGEEVYGGSDLTVVRGDFDALLASPLAPEVVQAVDQARRYHAAVQECFPGLLITRSNYDIVAGRDAQGRARSAVLEQSWRVGGATGAELAALEVFRQQPQRRQVVARGTEVFGDSPEPPPQAAVYFRGTDPEAGPLTKYTVVDGE